MSTLSSRQKTIVIILLVCLIPLVMGIQRAIDPDRPTFRGGGGVPSPAEGVSAGLIGAVLSGFREVVAGLLWVKTDDFFHEGRYSAMVPLCYVIVFLDPHQIDVFATGAWHFAYNFTDKNELSDRRFIPTAVSFLERGVEANATVYDLYAEMGWMYFDKIKDYAKAIEWYQKARQFPNHPSTVDRNLAHAYEKAGLLDKAIETWREVVKDAEAKYKEAQASAKKDNENLYRLGVDLGVARHNLEITLIRKILRKDLAKKPMKVNLQVTWKKIKPRVIRVEGKANLPEASRLDILLKDKTYEEDMNKSFAWRIDNSTIYVNSVQIRPNKTFSVDIEMDKDLQMYPLQSDRYVLEVSFNPRTAPVQVQDFTGWNGEGITDDPKRVEIVNRPPGLPYKRIVLRVDLKKSDIV